MDAKTSEALEASIAKWERNAVVSEPKQYTFTWEDCPLCVLFLGGVKERCDGCPVKAKTGQASCDGTPYYPAQQAAQAWDWAVFEDGGHSARTVALRDKARAAAREEVEFLKSLREDN